MRKTGQEQTISMVQKLIGLTETITTVTLTVTRKQTGVGTIWMAIPRVRIGILHQVPVMEQLDFPPPLTIKDLTRLGLNVIKPDALSAGLTPELSGTDARESTKGLGGA